MRKTFGLLCAAALMLPIGVIAAQPAAAVTVSHCTKASGTATFTPPLPKLGDTHKVKSKLTSKGTVSGCSGGGVKGGSTTFKQTSVSATGSNCGTLVAPKKTDKPTVGIFTVKWNTGKTSTAKSFSIKQTNATTANIAGKITSGLFIGKTIKGTVTFTPEKDGCTKKPLAHVTYKNKGNTTVG